MFLVLRFILRKIYAFPIMNNNTYNAYAQITICGY